LNELKDTAELIGSWIMTNGRMVEDQTSCLIRDLIEHRLQKVTVASDGWEVLYLDPQDQRFWELIFPHGEMQGGGPRTLRVLSVEAAKLKYYLPTWTRLPQKWLNELPGKSRFRQLQFSVVENRAMHSSSLWSSHSELG